MQIIEVSFSFSTSALFAFLVSLGSKNQTHFENNCTAKYRSVIPLWRNAKKRKLYWSFLMLKLHFLQNYSVQFFHLRFKRKLFDCRGVFNWIFFFNFQFFFLALESWDGKCKGVPLVSNYLDIQTFHLSMTTSLICSLTISFHSSKRVKAYTN